jgi:hypothetical protein
MALLISTRFARASLLLGTAATVAATALVIICNSGQHQCYNQYLHWQLFYAHHNSAAFSLMGYKPMLAASLYACFVCLSANVTSYFGWWEI